MELPLEAVRPVDAKAQESFDASFGLNPMSAEDPSWIGHGFSAKAAEDFLSSPDWSDPSPALTDSLTFDMESCDPSPLLPMNDNYEGDFAGVPGIAGAPLFSPMQGYASSNVSPNEGYHADFSGSGDFGSSNADFTLFPAENDEAKPHAIDEHSPSGTSPRIRLGQMAFSKESQEDPAITLFRALSSAALTSSSVPAPVPITNVAQAKARGPVTASPLVLSSLTTPPLETVSEPQSSSLFDDVIDSAPAAPAATAPAPAPTRTDALVPVSAVHAASPCTEASNTPTKTVADARGVKRRLDASDLLPLDAPIQPRKYHTVSATSRRDATPVDSSNIPTDDPFAAEEAALRREKDPRVAKRLSNTLAARRSRHRKAEELRILHETIESLKNEVQTWKKRCERAEQERDEARAN
ncbi:hypothetical protein IE53DRAFT_376315 [Violaceomyces palustris]|uniref:Uncharacterized protein n=1 Tax=Violaceomyces palustris TaxID=1673888 RepID=A0ACD0NM24_9BASI|nr:hypothetical protein IE53DRAFT_376315 [Violaceomyces palustris]